MKTSFGKKPKVSPCFLDFYNSQIERPTASRVHSILTRAEHNEVVSILRSHVEHFTHIPVLLPQYLVVGFSWFEKLNLPKYMPPAARGKCSEQTALKIMRDFFTAYLDQCDTIVPIVFADEEGAVS